jgi:uncharacterized membrane protein
MIKQLMSLNKLIQGLPIEELVKELPEDELKALYVLIQVFRILTVMTWVFSFIAFYFIAVLLNPQSSLIDWSREHKYLIIAILAAFLFMPASVIFTGTSELELIATSLFRVTALEALSPRNVWIIRFLISSLILPLMVFIYSVSGLSNRD